MNVDQAKRQAEADRIRGVALERIHTEACRVVPTRNDMLDCLPKGGVAVEVGVASGDFSVEILNRLHPKKLYLVDAWQDDRFAEGYEVVREKFARHIEDGTIELRRGLSTDVLSSFPDGYFDFIYLDTTHAYDLTIRELELSSAKSSERGLIAGHDFCAGNVVAPHVYGVIQATGRVCRESRWRYKYISIDPDTYFSFCLERLDA
jgi:predicted O-methyltransferase YrrM